MYIDQLKIQHEYSRERDCKDITRDELLAYFGLLYLIGIKKAHLSNVKEIFANDGTGIQIVRAAMSYKRFLFITRCLRFDDKAPRDERRRTDKLAAIRQFFYPFVENCKSSFNLSQYTTIDEMLHPFRGRCRFVQYIPSKPAKYGIKMFALCDAESFYTSNIEIYCGKQPEGPYAVSNTPTDIVKRLITPIANSGRNLTIDNWYTNIPLADELLGKKITVVGTLKKNKREIPPEFQPQKQRNLSLALMKEHMIARSQIKSLSLDVKAFLKANYSCFEKKLEVVTNYTPKRGVCPSCVLEKERTSASMKCTRCKVNVSSISICMFKLPYFAKNVPANP
ncbi:hypothetical protein NQ318_023601 [Aromia moschata]|uniref:PiggyBac transposable element-derived protein domain-containing protein n=1 Tax=Aromia moschata TaxID=1265417 RepID=A0AAV8YQ86_9CUCU|nr:hypothetical protein NQ318_023601 [Aromia moschata]